MAAAAGLGDDGGYGLVKGEDAMTTTTDIRTLLGELRQDHRNMAVLLGLVREEARKADRGSDPDFELLEDILHYLTVYSDAVHHPREDRLYSQLASAGKGQGLAFVESDHRTLAVDGKTLKDDCEAVLAGAALSRTKFVADAVRYVDRLDEHMQWEETDLFKRADTLADEEIDITGLAESDPVFGPQPGEAFETLLERMRDSVGA